MAPQVSLRAGRGSIALVTLILAGMVAMRPSPARGQDLRPLAPTCQLRDGAGRMGALPGGSNT